MYKKNKKTINYIIIFFICIALFISSMISQDEFHLDNCHDKDCFRCNIIKIAQTIISMTIMLIIFVIIGFLIYLFLLRLHNKYKKIVQSSLVIQKVQLNE